MITVPVPAHGAAIVHGPEAGGESRSGPMITDPVPAHGAAVVHGPEAGGEIGVDR